MSQELIPFTSSSAPLLPSPSQFEVYARAVNSIPLLSEEEEMRLTQAWYNHQDRNAARDLVLSHLRLVVKAVRDHAGYGLSPSDLAQEGTVGLMRAIHGFNPSQNVRLAAYAWKWIEAEIREFIFKSWRLVRLGSGSTMRKLFFNYRKTVESLKKLAPDRQMGVSTQDIAKALDLPEDQVELASRYFLGQDVSMAPSDSEGSHYEGTEGLQLEASQHAAWTASDNPEDYTTEAQSTQMGRKAIAKALLSLDDRSREILMARRLSEPAVSLKELSAQWDVSIERVRQIEHQAWDNLVKNAQQQLHVLPA